MTSGPGADPALDEHIARNDLDELIREVDRRTDAHDWDGLVRVRDRCRAAFERGYQLWPASSLAEYRLALRAPARFAAAAVAEGAGRFALGPLSEVAASTHTWDELAPHLPDGPIAGVVAHERVVRGDDLRNADVPFADVFDMPLALEAWEPTWPIATYRDNDLDEPRPALPRLEPVVLPASVTTTSDPDVEAALLAVVEQWVSQSNGQVAVTTVDGSAFDAIAALSSGAARAAEVDAATALAQLGWAGASGGAHGRRRGAASGRDLALGCLTALGGADRLADLSWWMWDDGAPLTGWHLFLAAANRTAGRAWVLRATDHTT